MLKIKSKLIKIILVEPAGEINVGSVARLCFNFGIDELRIVSPRCNPISNEAKKMAVKGKTLLENANKYSSLIEAIADCSQVIATCGRQDHGDIPLHSPSQTMKWILNSSTYSPTALVFGREDRGLTNQELLLANKVITIQTSKEYPSLNLSHAVAITLHEMNQARDIKYSESVINNYNPASPLELSECLNDAQSLLLNIGFLMKHTASSRMSKLKNLLYRAEIRKEEVALIRGIISQTKWALKKNNNLIKIAKKKGD